MMMKMAMAMRMSAPAGSQGPFPCARQTVAGSVPHAWSACFLSVIVGRYWLKYSAFLSAMSSTSQVLNASPLSSLPIN